MSTVPAPHVERSEIDAVRRFNRTVTQRVGALDDAYLARDRPLGASRLLWEIGDEGVDARTLRERLDLDSGYLSRLLQSLRRDGLVTLEPGEDDRRIRIARPTAAGRRERAVLDARSDDLARDLLAPLDDLQRRRLVEAVETVERLLTAGLVEIGIEDASTEAAQFCIGSYYAELDERFEHGFDPDVARSTTVEELTEPNGLLLVARLRSEPIGCGALRFHGSEPAEIKRLWVARSARGLGLGRRLLVALERIAADRGLSAVRLDTNRTLTEAIALYHSAGYREIDAFNDEPFAHHWFEKQLD